MSNARRYTKSDFARTFRDIKTKEVVETWDFGSYDEAMQFIDASNLPTGCTFEIWDAETNELMEEI
jgi:hypothetical protein